MACATTAYRRVIAHFEESAAGLKVTMAKYQSYVCEPERAPKPLLLSPNDRINGRGVWIFQINVESDMF